MWWVFTVDCCVNLMRSPGWDAAVVHQQQRGWARLESPPPPSPLHNPAAFQLNQDPQPPPPPAPPTGSPPPPHFLRPAVSCAKVSRIFRGAQ